MDTRDGMKLLYSPEEIKKTVKRLAGELRPEMKGAPVFIGVLKGAFMFVSDLIRELNGAVEVDFIQAASYGLKDEPSTEVRIKGDITVDIKGRDVIIVEGIIDRGTTVRAVMGHLRKKGPASVKVCTLLLRDSHAGMEIDYVGARVYEGFVVGYGMDYKEEYRNLPGIYILEPPRPKAARIGR
ncbi:MAG: hypoxanthine phosphoribosyltransferase [Deltaproteobacteria bacterium]|nr:hypoxanthine phosphoribosyltransferase [Deltaproteobacteria bacterium]